MVPYRRIALASLAAGLLAFAPPTAPDWVALGTGGQFGACIAGAGDVNGDGFEDVLVGDPDDNAGGPKAGKVSVFLGGPSGLATTPAAELKGVANARFGTDVAGIGDVDGDGLDDVVVASPGASAVSVFYGEAGRGLSATPAWEATYSGNPGMPMPVAGLGDLNGDGGAEFAVGVPWEGYVQIWSFPPPQVGGGVPHQALQPEAMALVGPDTAWPFGIQLAVGDFDGDDVPDLAVAAGGFDAAGGDASVVLIFAGATLPDSAVWWQSSEAGDGGYGESIAAADLNGDGLDDVIVGARYHHDAAGEKAGAVFVYLMTANGSPNAPAMADGILVGEVGSSYGAAVAGVGDIDADGCEEFAVGVTGGTDATDGKVYVYRGGMPYGPGTIAYAEYSGLAGSFGSAVASADINGDDHPDLFIGDPGFNGGMGRAICYYGQETSPKPPGGVTMRRTDGSTIAPGGTTSEATLIVEGVVDHPAVLPCALEVQIGFTGTPFPPDAPFAASGLEVPNGATATGTVGGLQPGHSYWVRVRAGDGLGRVSGWTHVGTESSSEADVMTASNFPPSVAMLKQLRVADAVAIAPATSLVTDKVRFQANVSDADGDSFMFAVEVRLVGEAFTGVPTGTAGPFAPGAVSIDLAVPEGAVKWQAWAISSAFAMEAPKVRFGSGSQVDFFVLAFGSISKGACSVSGQDPGGFPWWTLLSASAFLKRRRRRRPAR